MSHDQKHVVIPEGSRDYTDECDESNELDAIPTVRCWDGPQLNSQRFHLGCNDVNWYVGDDGDYPHVDEEEVELQANDGSTQNVENNEGIVLESVKIGQYISDM